METTQTFFQRAGHISLGCPAQMPALNDKMPSDFPDWQNPPEKKERQEFRK